MNRLFFFFLLILPSKVSAQTFINKSRKQVKKELVEKETKLFPGKYSIAENDTTLVLTIRQINKPPAEYIYYFDKNGKCKEEEIILNCDSCLNKILNGITALKNYHWKKINENQYVSDYSSKLMIELPPENTNYSLSILKMNWTRQLYDLLLSNE